ncbi:MAG: hypothetical protein J5819_10400 [Eubacterium sp.]|nr:hypothetical protein [Eubacterium sp.]
MGRGGYDKGATDFSGQPDVRYMSKMTTLLSPEQGGHFSDLRLSFPMVKPNAKQVNPKLNTEITLMTSIVTALLSQIPK